MTISRLQPPRRARQRCRQIPLSLFRSCRRPSPCLPKYEFLSIQVRLNFSSLYRFQMLLWRQDRRLMAVKRFKSARWIFFSPGVFHFKDFFLLLPVAEWCNNVSFFSGSSWICPILRNRLCAPWSEHGHQFHITSLPQHSLKNKLLKIRRSTDTRFLLLRTLYHSMFPATPHYQRWVFNLVRIGGFCFTRSS